MPALTAATLDIGANGQYKATQATITADKPAWNSSATWNAGAVAFTHLKANVTDTASAAGSLLVDLQVGGVSQFKVSKAGALTAGTYNGQTITSAASLTGTLAVAGAVTLSSTLAVSGQATITRTSGDTWLRLTNTTLAENANLSWNGDTLTFDVASASNRLLAFTNSGAGVFNLSCDGAMAIGNTVAAAAGVASTHKVTMVIGGVTYYLLATNVA